MMGLVIAGRFARNIEQANPGRSLNEVLRASVAVRAASVAPTRAVPVARTANVRPAAVPQAASLAELN